MPRRTSKGSPRNPTGGEKENTDEGKLEEKTSGVEEEETPPPLAALHQHTTEEESTHTSARIYRKETVKAESPEDANISSTTTVEMRPTTRSDLPVAESWEVVKPPLPLNFEGDPAKQISWSLNVFELPPGIGSLFDLSWLVRAFASPSLSCVTSCSKHNTPPLLQLTPPSSLRLAVIPR